MLNKLKENFLLRSTFNYILRHYDTRRKIKGLNNYLFFNAGTNLHFFFKRELQIENEASENLNKLIKENFLVFDIGAHIGYYTVILSNLLKIGKLIAFEPNSDSVKYLKKNVEVNSLKNVSVVEKGISSKIGQSRFYKDISTGRSSSLEINAWHPNAAKIKEEIINTTTLDEATQQYGVPDFIKCDVEGHELEVLKGASEVLKSKPILFLEVSSLNRKSILEILHNHSYNIYNGEVLLESQSQPLQNINCQNIICI